MRILWLSNVSICNSISNGSGSWLFAMKDLLKSEVELINITDGVSNEVVYNAEENVVEYLLPVFGIGNKPINDVEKKDIILSLICKIKPDLIHIWGLEKKWSKYIDKSFKDCPVLLEIQGLRSSLANVYTAGIDYCDIISNIGAFELKHPKSIPFIQKKIIGEQALKEFEIIDEYEYIGCPSAWVKDQIEVNCKRHKQFFLSSIPLRKEFYTSRRWEENDNDFFNIFFITSYFAPFKGFHTLLKAFSKVVQFYPSTRLVVAGPELLGVSAYEKYILRIIKKNNLNNNIIFIGRLDSNELIKNLLNCDIFINPSFVESYSVTTAEALYLGVPSILTYSAALPEFNKKGTALYYNAIEIDTCASRIIELIKKKGQCDCISETSYPLYSDVLQLGYVLKKQLDIYERVIKGCK